MIAVSSDPALLPCPPQPAGSKGREKGRVSSDPARRALIEDTELKCQLLGRQHVPREQYRTMNFRHPDGDENSNHKA